MCKVGADDADGRQPRIKKVEHGQAQGAGTYGAHDVATSRRTTLSNLIGSIDTERQQGNLSSALRLFVLNHYQARAA